MMVFDGGREENLSIQYFSETIVACGKTWGAVIR